MISFDEASAIENDSGKEIAVDEMWYDDIWHGACSGVGVGVGVVVGMEAEGLNFPPCPAKHYPYQTHGLCALWQQHQRSNVGFRQAVSLQNHLNGFQLSYAMTWLSDLILAHLSLPCASRRPTGS